MSNLTDLSNYVALDKGDGSYPVIIEICRCGGCPYKEITRQKLWERILDLSKALVMARELFAEVYEKPKEEEPPPPVYYNFSPLVPLHRIEIND